MNKKNLLKTIATSVLFIGLSAMSVKAMEEDSQKIFTRLQRTAEITGFSENPETNQNLQTLWQGVIKAKHTIENRNDYNDLGDLGKRVIEAEVLKLLKSFERNLVGLQEKDARNSRLIADGQRAYEKALAEKMAEFEALNLTPAPKPQPTVQENESVFRKWQQFIARAASGEEITDLFRVEYLKIRQEAYAIDDLQSIEDFANEVDAAEGKLDAQVRTALGL